MLLAVIYLFSCSTTASHPSVSSHAGQDQDWSAIAAVQCRLDREGATKLVADLIMNTKNEKIFQESILLAIRLLDGGNTEIQVLSPGCTLGTSPRGTGQPRFHVCGVTIPALRRCGLAPGQQALPKYCLVARVCWLSGGGTAEICLVLSFPAPWLGQA